MARLGFRTIAEMVGHVEALDTQAAVDHWKARGLDISPILAVPQNPYGQTMLNSVRQDHGLDEKLDQQFIELAASALAHGEPVRNVDRTVGTLLGNAVTRRYGGQGLPDGTIDIHLRGSAGQSFGAFVPKGITLTLEGDANDYVGKGLSGGRVIVRPDRSAGFDASTSVIAGNVIGYGATGGEIFLRGVVGERFCVRNSGATAVVEGVGDHGCEYMTGGRVVVLGPTGRNFGAGMSGGIAFVHDPHETFGALVNGEMVELQALTPADVQWLRETITRHAEFTGSHVAQALLDDWDGAAAQFKRVMPIDYQRVLLIMSEAQAEGLSETATLDRVMEASRG